MRVCCLLLLTGCLLPILSADAPSNLRPAYQRAYDATPGRPHYSIELTLTGGGRFAGLMRLIYTNRRAQGIGAIDLELFPERFRQGLDGKGRLSIVGAVSDREGRALRTSRPVRGRLRIWLRGLLMPGERVQLSLRFSGQLPPMIGRSPALGLAFGLQDSFHYMYAYHPVLALETASGWAEAPPERGYGDVYRAAIADWRVRITLPEALRIAAPGVEWRGKSGRRARVEAGQRTVTYRGLGLRDFTFIAARGLRTMRRMVGGVELRVTYRSGETKVARGALDIGAESLALFEKSFGGYPYKRLSIVFGPLPHIGGLEHSTLVVIGDYPIPRRYKLVTVHEVAHQWWYLIVGSDQPSWPFLDEGLAAYSEWIFLREARGKRALRAHLAGRRRLRLGRHRLLAPIDAFGSAASYSRTVYVDGAYWHSRLASMAGEARYLKALRRFVSRYRWQLASPRQLVQSLKQDLPRDTHGKLDALLKEP